MEYCLGSASDLLEGRFPLIIKRKSIIRKASVRDFLMYKFSRKTKNLNLAMFLVQYALASLNIM